MRADVNLCDVERGRRLRVATMGLAVVVAQMIVLTEVGAAPIWWATLALPLAVVSFQVAQAYTGVCVSQARAGTRRFGSEIEPILDPRKRMLVQQRARAVTVAALVMTVLSTALVLALVYLT
jgi:hypothetical protein